MGMVIIHINAGIDSEKSSKSISFIGASINRPTNTNTGDVATPGIERNSGEKSIAAMKHKATTKEVSPDQL